VHDCLLILRISLCKVLIFLYIYIREIDSSIKLVSPGSILLNGLLLSTVLGAIGSILLIGFSDPMISHVFGSDVANIPARVCAVEYLRVRSLAVPLVLMNYVITGFCLGIQNIKVPVLCTLLSAGMNILGDYIFVSKLGLGLKGTINSSCMGYLSIEITTACSQVQP
jgi:Na+-driven multidrug efflux pump